MRDSYEEHERTLQPHRIEEQRSARQEAVDRLADRGIPIYASDSDDEVADLLEAVERFESVVESLGGDLMINRIGSDEPQDPAFILPTREQEDRAEDYRARVLAAASALRRRQRAD